MPLIPGYIALIRFALCCTEAYRTWLAAPPFSPHFPSSSWLPTPHFPFSPFSSPHLPLSLLFPLFLNLFPFLLYISHIYNLSCSLSFPLSPYLISTLFRLSSLPFSPGLAPPPFSSPSFCLFCSSHITFYTISIWLPRFLPPPSVSIESVMSVSARL